MSMANVTLEPVVDSIHKLARNWTNRDANDADLLNRFVARQVEKDRGVPSTMARPFKWQRSSAASAEMNGGRQRGTKL